MSKLSLFCLLTVALSVPLFANAHDGGHDNIPSLTFEQFKESCLHPEHFRAQVPPSNIRVQCTDVSKEFVAAAAGQVPLPSQRKIVAAIFSSKYYVNAEAKEIPFASKGGNCFKYKEVEKTFTVERVLTCDDILGIKGDLHEYCASNLDLAKGGNAKLTDIRDTGKYMDTCSAHVPHPGPAPVPVPKP